jgi:hypothetical protein
MARNCKKWRAKYGARTGKVSPLGLERVNILADYLNVAQTVGAGDMTDLDFYLPIALVVLLAYLLWSFNRRLNAEIARVQARYKDWHGHGFEAATVSPKIEILRRDYVSAVRSRRPVACSHNERVAMARCAVRELSFFRMIRGAAAKRSDEKPTTSA